MDKYQKIFLKNIKIQSDYCNFPENETTCIIAQPEDITIPKTAITFSSTYPIKVVFHTKDGNKIEAIKNKEDIVKMNVDFEPEIYSKFEIISMSGVVDPVIFNIVYKLADKNAYYEKEAIESAKALRKERLSALNLKHSVGTSLVNIYFQRSNDAVNKTMIELYTAKGDFYPAPAVIGKNDVYTPRLKGGRIEQLIGRYSVEEGMFFKSITGLARGAYGYKLSQYDEKGNLIIETDYDYFYVSN